MTTTGNDTPAGGATLAATRLLGVRFTVARPVNAVLAAQGIDTAPATASGRRLSLSIGNRP